MVIPGKGSRRKISWDVVRAGCVTLVMLYHSTTVSVEFHPEIEPRTFAFPWQVGASMLLVISAYFACVTIGRGTVLRYWWGRIARLLPAFVAASVLIFLLTRAFRIEGWYLPSVRDLFEHLLMLWHWNPAEFEFLDVAHWTVPLQLMGFTAAALLYRSRWGHGDRIIGVLWLAMLLPLVQWPIRASEPPELYRMLADGLGFHRWHLFVAGVAIWLWSVRRIRTTHFAALLGTAMFAQWLHSFTIAPSGELVPDVGSSVCVAIGLCVIALVARGPDWDAVIPVAARRPIQWYAGISYGVYLTHQSLGHMVVRRLQDLGAPTSLQTLAMLATGVLLGWGITRVVEQPAHRYLMRTYDRFVTERSAVSSGA
ncbi:acyltransferase [Actinopolyspora erythraea]|uniref:Acyltransferase n=1 Tax=Actinopolyspora erythraea TaxID=414996 RepID=A0A099D0X7_9ACTN|nr:acyltransferase [Actinopolyspora erythraea]ASU79711.1 acyltransferase [Actinopolyspora erythraea]KGI79571.1 acyltransferase [Actinopolyspora erythraea]